MRSTTLFVALTTFVLQCWITHGLLPVAINITALNEDRSECSVANVQHNTTKSQLRRNIAVILQDTVTPALQNSSTYPAPSCQNISVGSPSGYYWIRPSGFQNTALQYCDMSERCCNTTGWMRVANFDMTDPNQQCPSGFRLVTSPIRTCGRPGAGCVSTTFPVYGVEYSRVCGRIKAYQYSSSDAFEPFYLDRSRTIDDVYVDGVSLTHGQSPRKHIWTFANALDEYTHDPVGPIPNDQQFKCPCTHTDRTYTGVVPPFIGQDYFCDSGSRDAWIWHMFYTEDPLWDGQGCGPTSSCCSFNNPPWFCKQLPQPTSDDIELRLCSNTDPIQNEDILLEIVELYVQ